MIKDIYNKHLVYKLNQLKGITPTQALVRILEDEEHNWEYDYITDEKGHVNTLFITNKKLIKLACAYPEVILIDCTYKTNKYCILLLYIMGVVLASNKLKYSNGSNFLIGFIFLSGETEDEYDIAIQCFKYYVFSDSGKQLEVFYRDGEDALGNTITKAFLVVP
jgi:hypothetical protein